jgi:hypothetical protein
MTFKLMGTSNFSVKNATFIFAVLESYEDTDTDYKDEENKSEPVLISATEDDLEMLIECLTEAIKEKFKDTDYSIESCDKSDNERSYTATTFLYIECSQEQFTLTLYCDIRQAYYDGANLDYHVEIETDNNSYDTTEDLKEYEPNLYELVNSFYDKLCKELEEVYTEHSTVYKRIGGFSDGTSLYELVKPEAVEVVKSKPIISEDELIRVIELIGGGEQEELSSFLELIKTEYGIDTQEIQNQVNAYQLS